MSWSYIARYLNTMLMKEANTLLRLCTHKRYPILRLCGRDMGHRFGVIWRKDTTRLSGVHWFKPLGIRLLMVQQTHLTTPKMAHCGIWDWCIVRFLQQVAAEIRAWIHNYVNPGCGRSRRSSDLEVSIAPGRRAEILIAVTAGGYCLTRVCSRSHPHLNSIFASK